MRPYPGLQRHSLLASYAVAAAALSRKRGDHQLMLALEKYSTSGAQELPTNGPKGTSE
jgi:hypothetical protein